MTAPQGSQTAQPGQVAETGEQTGEVSYPLGYTSELGARVCELIANGSNLFRIGEDNSNGLPGRTRLYEWRREIAEFENIYVRAREARADARADKIDETVQKVEDGELEPNAARVIIDAHKWQAGKEKPHVYNDKTIIEGGERPIKTDAPDPFEMAKRVALLLRMGQQPLVIDGECAAQEVELIEGQNTSEPTTS